MNKIRTALLAMALAFHAFAAEEAAPAKQSPEGPAACTQKKCCRKDPACHAKKMKQPKSIRAKANVAIQEKFPEEYAELQELRKEAAEKQRAVREKFESLAKRAGIVLPNVERREKMAAFRKKYEKELKEIEALRKTNPKAAREKRSELLKKEGISFPPSCRKKAKDGKAASAPQQEKSAEVTPPAQQ